MASSDAFLAAIAVTAGSSNYGLRPSFDPTILRYICFLPSTATSLTVTPWADNPGTIKVNGVSVTSGSASGSITLNPGVNMIVITVTAADTTSFLNYVIAAVVAVTSPVLTNYFVTLKDTTIQEVTNSLPPVLIPQRVYDGYYRDLPSATGITIAAATDAQAFFLLRLTPGQTDNIIPSGDITPALPATPAIGTPLNTGPDDLLKIPLKQTTYLQSFWTFFDPAGNTLAAFDIDNVDGISNDAPEED
jgi:Cadherin-like beta sandwich domain